MPDGTCMYTTCPLYSYPDWLPGKLDCISQSCKKDEKLLETGKCEKCPPYTNAGGKIKGLNFIECLPETCKNNQINVLDGTCRSCAKGTIPSLDKRRCMLPYCNTDMGLKLVDGKCVDPGFSSNELLTELMEFKDDLDLEDWENNFLM